MRITPRTGRFQEDIRKAALVLVVVVFFILPLLSSCGTADKRSNAKRLSHKVKIERENLPDTSARKEIIRNEPRPLSVGATPKATASAKTVEIGRREYADGDYERAERTFQEAINIDPSNGIAYYYLAKAKYETGMYLPANGVLDKAAALLAGSKEWMEAVDILRKMIKERQIMGDL